MEGRPSAAFLSADNRDRWRHVQDSLSRITGLSLWTIAREGKVIGSPSAPPGLCLYLRGNPAARELCNRDCIQNSRMAMRGNATAFFRCHADLQCFAAPLRSLGKPVGVILGGQVLTGPPPLERFRQLARECGLPEEELRKAVAGLTIGTEKALRQAADFVAEMAEVIFSGWESQSGASRRLALLGNLFSISSEFSPEMDPHEMYALILNSLAILFDIQNAALFTPDRENGSFVPRYAFGPRHEKLMRVRLSRQESFLEEFYRNPGPFATDDYYLLLRAGFPEEVKQATVFPLFSGEEISTILAVFNHSLDEEERRMIASFASQAAVTLQNSLLRAELQSKVVSLSTLSGFNERISRTRDMDDLLSLIFEETAGLARAERASLMLLNEKTRELHVKMVKGSHEEVLRNHVVSLDQGLSGEVCQSGEALLVKDLRQDARVGRANRSTYRTPSFIILPLKAGGRTIGVLNIADKISGKVFDEEDLNLLRSLSAQAAVALERAELFELSCELKKISITDPLTGLLNRRYFQERATEEIERSKRYAQPLSLTMVDVDDFKFYNDSHGHPAGDELLKGVGTVIKTLVRNIDVVSRYGGEEFAILSPSCDRERALQIAERVRQGIRDHVFPREKEQPGGDLTISAGTATFPDSAPSLEDLISNADQALYRSKREGKNRSTSFSPPA